jgi:hypothetical protein
VLWSGARPAAGVDAHSRRSVAHDPTNAERLHHRHICRSAGPTCAKLHTVFRALYASTRALLGIALTVVLVVIVAVEGTVFAVALYAKAVGADGHFRGGFPGFLIQLTFFLLAIAGRRAMGRGRQAARTA